MQEQPTLEMVSVGLATHATSNSNRSFSTVLIMLSYRMSAWKRKTKISLNSVVKEWVEMASLAKGESLSNKKMIHLGGKKQSSWIFLNLNLACINRCMMKYMIYFDVLMYIFQSDAYNSSTSTEENTYSVTSSW